MLYLGTCSFNYPSWETLVYTDPDPATFLAQYATQYASVEIDQWFWSLGKSSVRLPDSTTVALYDAATPKEFRFTIKAPNALSSPFAYRSKKERNRWFLDVELYYRFLDQLAPLFDKIGAIILQFPYLNREAFSERAHFNDALADFVQRTPDTISLAIEIRNPQWLDDSWFALLDEYSVAPTLLSGYWMDGFLQSVQSALTYPSDLLIIRLHGSDRGAIEALTGEVWNRRVQPQVQELTALAALLKGQQEREIYLNVNNHYEGSAPLTIAFLEKLL